MIKIKSQQDFWAGLFFLGSGAFELWLAVHYEIGSPADMGPGFMPVLLGCGLTVLGFAIATGALLISGPDIEASHWRPFVCIILALLAFAVLISRLGLPLTTFVVALLGGCAYRDKIFWKQLLLLSVGLAIFTVVLFVYVLGQPVPVWWGSA
ncbi:MAG: tripartite tricarboxylate transporter TctB family protein [Bradyrhizobium sp.]